MTAPTGIRLPAAERRSALVDAGLRVFSEGSYAGATTAQIAALVSAGCEVVRCAVPKIEDAEALKRIVRFSPIPVIADIHFNASLALKAIDGGVAAVRINPGNIGGPDKVELVVKAAKKAGIAMRIGANSGSLPRHLDHVAQRDQAEALVAAAIEEVELLEKLRGRAIPREAYERFSAVGIALVLMLFFIGLSNDIGRLGGT